MQVLGHLTCRPSLKAAILDFNSNQIGLDPSFKKGRRKLAYIGTDLVNLKIKWSLSNRILIVKPNVKA